MAFSYTSIPTVGKLRAAILSSLITELRPLRAIQTAPVTKNNTTTLSDLTGLTLAVAASQSYWIRGRLVVTGANTTHDVKIGLTFPSGATGEWSCYAHATGSTATPDTIDTGTTSIANAHTRGSVVGDLTYRFEGVITTSTTAGNLTIQGAQATANVSDCVFKANSTLELEIF